MAAEDGKFEHEVTLTVPQGYGEGVRLDRYITRFLPNVSRTKVQRGILEGYVTVNGAAVDRPSYNVQADDIIVCRLMRPPPIEAQPEDIPLDIVYEDEYLLVVNKPAGMVVHPAYGNRSGTLVNALLHYVGAGTIQITTEEEDGEVEDEDLGLSTISAQRQHPGDLSLRPGIVHRLDKDTSGLLVVAKDDVTHRELAKQFVDRSIERRYIGILWGLPDPPRGRIEGEVGRDPRDRKRMTVVARGRGKHAVTHFEVLEPFLFTSIAAFRLETGRTHQIRVHAKQINHPILGDATYGGDTVRYGPVTLKRKAFFKNLFERIPRQALHAETLGFLHPRTGEPMHFQVDPPEDMQYAIRRLREIEGG
jgi:23S rRNA pseudouridine1911/1915/1917 synthase